MLSQLTSRIQQGPVIGLRLPQMAEIVATLPPVPWLEFDPKRPPRIATFNELTFPFFLFLGLATRLATLSRCSCRRHRDFRLCTGLGQASALGLDSRVSEHSLPPAHFSLD